MTTLTRHIQAQTELGQLMTLNINTFQLLSGFMEQFLSHTQKITYLPLNWLSHIQEYLRTCQLKLYSDSFWIPPKEREKDIGIMDRALQLYQDKNVLRRINNWRIFFQLLTLSDMCNSSGDQLLYEYWHHPNKHNYNHQRRSNLNWPHQGLPSVKCFKVWEKFLSAGFGLNPKKENGKIKYKLGNWFPASIHPINTWAGYYSKTTNNLYKTEQHHYNIHQSIARERRKQHFSHNVMEICQELPPDAIPVTMLSSQAEYLRITTSYTAPTPLQQPRILHHRNSTFQEFLDIQPTWASDLCSAWASVDNQQQIIQLLTDPTKVIQIATDGSVQLGCGSYGVAIADDNSILFTNRGKIKSDINPVTVRRTEIFGVLSALTITRQLVRFSNLKQPIMVPLQSGAIMLEPFK